MNDFIIALMLTVILAFTSLLVFALCVKHTPGGESPNIAREFEQLNALRRKLSFFWRKRKLLACLMLLLTLWQYYFKLKKQNPIGYLDTILVGLMVSLLIAMSGTGFWGFAAKLLSSWFP